MVDTLESIRLVNRAKGGGRAVAVTLTEDGRRVAREVLTARDEGLQELLADLTSADRRLLGELLEKLLTRLYTEVGDSDLLCRLCDRTPCTDGAVCPVGQAERDAGR
jgi:predicted transcriptional regulator